MAHVKHQEDEGSMAPIEGQPNEPSQKIAQLEEKLEVLKAGRASKERQSNYYMAQGRAIRRVIALFDNVEDLVNEND
ncbi:hypothetical protein DFH29DRAFT_1001965 [Suillus ampliporus]|nr:hypothetical protein DFH29DRAFT_1001965 [Suillus ampliporus]